MAGRPLPAERDGAKPAPKPRGDETGPPLDQAATAAYVADMTLGLRLLARRAGLHFLAYLLDMAATEALDRSRRR